MAYAINEGGIRIARPCKRRRICAMPGCRRFGPKAETGVDRQTIQMTVDEFESIRLIDLEGMTQEQCAVQMNVARTTAQAIYNSARMKLAECIVNEKELHIEGGEYVLCDGSADPCGCRCPQRIMSTEIKPYRLKENIIMKIAVTYENGQVFQHFGHTEQFKLYNIENGAVASAAIVDTNGSGHGALAGFLQHAGADTLICGGIGGGAQQALAEAGIKLYGGVSGDADQAVDALLTGKLNFNPNVVCSHHGEQHSQSCGEHGCGEHQGNPL